MTKKGLEITFLHYGIRKEDMLTIETLCRQHELDFDWLKDEILKVFHELRVTNNDIDEKAITRLLEKALQKITNSLFYADPKN